MAGGIFCIENWSSDLRVGGSVRPLLESLDASHSAGVLHQRVETAEELTHYLSRFAGLSSYQVGYLAMHGSRGRVAVGRHRIDLDTLSEWARLDDAPRVEEDDEWILDLRGKVLHIGGCGTLRVSQAQLRRFRQQTGALAVTGYTRNVAWHEAAAFEVLLLSELAGAFDSGNPRPRPAISRAAVRAATLSDRLGFVCEPPRKRVVSLTSRRPRA
jgi:hypothetical protein